MDKKERRARGDGEQEDVNKFCGRKCDTKCIYSRASHAR